jgi:hypothetical protein
MPYILVNFVLEILSVIYFSLSTAALLYKRPIAIGFLPSGMQNRKWVLFVFYALLLTVTCFGAAYILLHTNNAYYHSISIFELFLFVGFVNSVVLFYKFLSRRYFLSMSRFWRGSVIALLSISANYVAFNVIVFIVTILFVIR